MRPSGLHPTGPSWQTLWLAVILGNGIILGFTLPLHFSLMAFSDDYGEWKTGYRTEGLVNSACSFGYKIGNGIGSALLGMILEIGGYVGDAAVQSASALRSIEVCFVWIPIAVYACGLLIMKFWKLDKEFPQIIADLKARQAK